VVRDSEIKTEQADDGADQPFGLPQSKAEHGAQRQRRRDRQGRIVGLTAPRGPWCCAPGRDRLFGEPHRQAATADISGELWMGSTLPYGTAQPDLPPVAAWGEAT
jgi:hypothetical protein